MPEPGGSRCPGHQDTCCVVQGGVEMPSLLPAEAAVSPELVFLNP